MTDPVRFIRVYVVVLLVGAAVGHYVAWVRLATLVTGGALLVWWTWAVGRRDRKTLGPRT